MTGSPPAPDLAIVVKADEGAASTAPGHATVTATERRQAEDSATAAQRRVTDGASSLVSRSGFASMALIVLLLGTGCSGPGAPDKDAAAKADPSPTPAPPEALAPAPNIRVGDDARTLLRPSGDLERLAIKVPDDLKDLKSLHVKERYGGLRDVSLNYDVASGRCSGVGEQHGVDFRFVTTSDGRMLATSREGDLGQRLAGRWVEISVYQFADSCPGGPLDVALGTVDGAGSRWLLDGAARIGADRVAGRRTVHFRKSEGGTTVDSWIAAEGPTSRLMRLVWRTDGRIVHTLLFSEFDSADPVDPEPPADRIIRGGEGVA